MQLQYMRIKVRPSQEAQNRIDTLQPYIKENGKPIKNRQFERFYGKVERLERPDWKVGEKVEDQMHELEEKNAYKGPTTRKIYI